MASQIPCHPFCHPCSLVNSTQGGKSIFRTIPAIWWMSPCQDRQAKLYHPLLDQGQYLCGSCHFSAGLCDIGGRMTSHDPWPRSLQKSETQTMDPWSLGRPPLGSVNRFCEFLSSRLVLYMARACKWLSIVFWYLAALVTVEPGRRSQFIASPLFWLLPHALFEHNTA